MILMSLENAWKIDMITIGERNRKKLIDDTKYEH